MTTINRNLSLLAEHVSTSNVLQISGGGTSLTNTPRATRAYKSDGLGGAYWGLNGVEDPDAAPWSLEDAAFVDEGGPQAFVLYVDNMALYRQLFIRMENVSQVPQYDNPAPTYEPLTISFGNYDPINYVFTPITGTATVVGKTVSNGIITDVAEVGVAAPFKITNITDPAGVPEYNPLPASGTITINSPDSGAIVAKVQSSSPTQYTPSVLYEFDNVTYVIDNPNVQFLAIQFSFNDTTNYFYGGSFYLYGVLK